MSAMQQTGRPTITLNVTVNGTAHRLLIEPREFLLDVLRTRLHLTGAKRSCDSQICGACTVLVDGRPVSACSLLAADAEGAAVQTIEGLSTGDRLHPLQEAFSECFAFQCGFCTPGMIMAASALLEENPHPTEADIRSYLRGNLCRCTGYKPIVNAVLRCAGGEGGHHD